MSTRKRMFGIYDYQANEWFKTGRTEKITPRFENVHDATQYVVKGGYSRSAPRAFYVKKKQSKKDAVIAAAREYMKYSSEWDPHDCKDGKLFHNLAMAFQVLDAK